MKEERKLMKDERKHHGAVDKSSSNNRSVLRTASAFVMLKIGPVRLALVGLTAGRQAGSPAGRQAGSPAGRQAGRPSDENLVV